MLDALIKKIKSKEVDVVFFNRTEQVAVNSTKNKSQDVDVVFFNRTKKVAVNSTKNHNQVRKTILWIAN